MKTKLTEIVFILDRSGSMAGPEKDTIGSFNSLIEKQKTEEGNACISTVLFDNRSEMLNDTISYVHCSAKPLNRWWRCLIEEDFKNREK